MTKIEHANITVPDVDAAIEFLKVIAPDFVVRRDERSENGYRWVHIGNEQYYIALQEPHLDSEPKKQLQAYKNYGVNHIALVVSNIADVEKTLVENAYKRSISAPREKFRKRIYFYDKAGFEWELVEYYSEKAHEKYLYE